MSDAHPPHDDSPHEGPIKTPKQLILAVLFSFLIPVIAIILLAVFVTSDVRPGAGSDLLSPEAVAQRIRPVGQLVVRDVTDVASMKPGDQVFAAQCAACHTSGVGGAPKLGDAAAWAPRLQAGYEVLLTSALKGKGAMPPQQGGDHSDLEIGRAVVHMANRSGGNLPDPKPATDTPSSGAAQAVQQAPVQIPPTTIPPTTLPAVAAATPAAGTTVAAAPPIYAQACAVCHASGVAGAPKLGDKAAWAPRLPQGLDGLTASVIKGKGAMPPRGGSTASDAELKSVVQYMVGTVR